MENILKRLDTTSNDYNDNANICSCLKIQKWFRHIMTTFKIKKYKTTIQKFIESTLITKRKKYVHQDTIFGDNSPENIKNLQVGHSVR